MTLSAGTRLGPYKILSPLGAGGMGEVYRAKDTRLGREVAIKVLPEEFAKNADRLARFEREAKAVAALNHPNILSIYDFGKEGDTAYAVTELLEGETLHKRLSSGAVPVRKAVEYATQIAKGLAAAHDKGIIHRDIKPENLFVTKDGHVKILDFGLAGHAPLPASTDTESPTVTRHTEPGTLMGTVGYMSPEQARGKPADQRSDLFSFGAVLYEMVSGRRAFQGESHADVLSAILKEDPPDLKVGGKPAAPALDHIVRVCLEKRPEDRFQSAHDLALALQGLSRTEAEPPKSKATQPSSEGLMKKYQGAIATSATLVMLVAIVMAFDIGGLRSKLFPATPSVQPIRSIAVLPLANLSGDPTQEYFSDGMTDAIIADLYKISGFEKVISRTSVMQYKGVKKPLPQIGHELGVEALLEGTVQREGGRVRIAVQLIDAKRDKHLWAESYDREMRDVLNLQSEIASAVAKQVQVALTPAEAAQVGKKRSVAPEVYDAYLKAATLGYTGKSEASVRDAMVSLERVLAKEPGFAPAWASLADAYEWLFFLGAKDPSAMRTKAKAALERALALDPDLAMAHSRLGWYKVIAEWDWEGADRELQTALRLDPNSVEVLRDYASYLTVMRRFDEAIAVGKKLVELDPLTPALRAYLTHAYQLSGRYAEAIAQADITLERQPMSPDELDDKCISQLFLGLRQEALSTLEQEERAYVAAGEPLYLPAFLGGNCARLGQEEKALAIVGRLEAMDSDDREVGFALGYLYAFLEDNDSAMRWFERGYQRRESMMAFVFSEPLPEGIRRDPRFKALLCKMKFPGACERLLE